MQHCGAVVRGAVAGQNESKGRISTQDEQVLFSLAKKPEAEMLKDVSSAQYAVSNLLLSTPLVNEQLQNKTLNEKQKGMNKLHLYFS